MLFAGLVIVLALLIYWKIKSKKPENFPPGPKWWPIVGCAAEFFIAREKTGYFYKAVNELTKKHSPSGHLLGLKIGKDYIVMVNSIEANREMLFNEDIDGRPKGIFFETNTREKRIGVSFTDGELWREQKKFLIQHMKNFGYSKTKMGDIVSSEGKIMVQDINRTINNTGNKSVVLEIYNFFNIYVLNTLWIIMAGQRCDSKDPEMKALQTMLFDVFANLQMVGAIFSQFPILSYLMPNLSGYNKFLLLQKRIWKFIRDELARHKENFDPDKEDKDFIDFYIRVLKERGETNTYSEKQLAAMCLDVFLAGTETTAKCMSFCLSYLVRNQDVQKKAQEEIDRVVGKDRMPNFSDRVNMPYNEAIVHESIRHLTGRTFTLPHRALVDTSLMGYNIPKNTMVLTNFSNILLNEKYFPDPYAFKPERFLVDDKVVLPDYYFPFGLAKRRCIGDSLARCDVFIFTATLLQQFSFLPAPGEPLPSLKHIDGATPSAAPFKTLVVPRINM